MKNDGRFHIYLFYLSYPRFGDQAKVINFFDRELQVHIGEYETNFRHMADLIEQEGGQAAVVRNIGVEEAVDAADLRLAVGDDLVLRETFHELRRHIFLGGNFTDQFFDDIQEADDTGHMAASIHYDSEVVAGFLKIFEERVGGAVFGDDERCFH